MRNHVFAMTSPETMNMNFAVNKLSFPQVAHTAYSNARFGSYALLKT
jgi:hypothetical protein